MSQVSTVRGPVEVADLGPTYMHEHIFVLTADVQQNYPGEWGSEDERVADAVTKLGALAAQGVRTIVDPTVVGLGRNLPRIQRVAEQVPDLNIIVATGLYTYDSVPFFFYHRGPALNEALGTEVPDPMVDMFVGDITEGITGTGVRAGMLKCAIEEHGMTPGVERVMRAVAAAHHQTGVPVTVHTHPGSRTGLEVKRVLCDSAGVDPGRVILGHSGDTADCDHLAELADAGFMLGMDRFGINLEVTFETRADTLVEMCRRGYAERMVLSQDAACYIDWIDPNVLPFLPQWHYLHIQDEVLPYAREHGVTEEQIAIMLTANPRRLFEPGTMSATRRFRIAAIPADGVGREVVAAGRTVLDALAAGSGGAFAFDWQEFGWGCEYFARTGRMMAEDGLTVLREFDAIYFGAVGWPGVPDHISLWGLRLAICQNFDQWANVRPVRFLPGVRSPLRKADDTELDWVVVRENSEGEYAGLGGRNLSARGPGSEVAVQSALFTEAGCERIMRFAFDLARTRTRRKVSSVTKSNAQQYGMVLWDDVFRRVALDYPDVETESVLVDAMSAKFVLHPEDLSVVVASNLHADILSDLGSALAGSLGLAASANLNPERRFPSMFEPVHGSAPDIAGQGLANPIGAVGSAAMMLGHLGLPEQAARLHSAIEATTAAGILTRDLGGAASTEDVTKALIDALNP